MLWDITVLIVNITEDKIVSIVYFLKSVIFCLFVYIYSLIPHSLKIKPSENTILNIALCITKFWALIGLYSTKIFELFFSLLLKLPDDKFALLSNLTFLNTTGDTINILFANDGKNNTITNKLKLFIKLYLERGGKYEIHSTNGFDFQKYEKLFNSSILYCYYMIENKKIERFWENLFKFIVKHVENDIIKIDQCGEKKLSLRNVDFDLETKEESFEDLARLIESFD